MTFNPDALPLLFFYLALALGVSFLCSVLEAVLLSITPSYIAQLDAEGHPAAGRLASYKEDIDRPLAAILSLNTVAHTIGASGAGVQAQAAFGESSVTIASIILTLLILIFSEIIPKTLGASFWKRLAPYSARILGILIVITAPLVWLSQGITKIIGGSGHHGPTLSREEFSAMADIGSKEGIFDEEESRILSNLFRFNALRAQDVMTPRTVILAFDQTLTASDAFNNEAFMRFSRIPVYDENLDTISGYVLKQDLLAEIAEDRHATELSTLKRELLILPASTTLMRTLDQMLEAHEHIALLVGEYGGTAGIVTMEDLVETLLGLEILDESDADVDMQALARGQWQKRARRLGLVTESDLENAAEKSDSDDEA